jgi:hypothetical protein
MSEAVSGMGGEGEKLLPFSKRLAVGHIASHVAIFRAQSSEQTISGSGGRTKMILGVLDWS